MGGEVASSTFAKKPEMIRDSIKSAFETVKQVTTLSAGSTVLLATFLKDIFAGAGGVETLADLTVRVKVMVVTAFLLFGLTLVFAMTSLGGLSGMLRSRLLSQDQIDSDEMERIRWKFRLFLVAPLFFTPVDS